MFFAEFVQLLHKHILCGKGKDRFMIEILTHSFPGYSRNSSAANKRYYDGKTDENGKIIGDTICSHLLDYYTKFSVEEFSKFIKKESGNEASIASIVKDFSEIISDINSENYDTKIAELLGRIYKSTAETASAAHRTSSLPKVKPNATSKQTILDIDRNLIAGIIAELIRDIDKLIEWSKSKDANRLDFSLNQSAIITVSREKEPGIVDKVFGTLQPEPMKICLSPVLEEMYNSFIRTNRQLEIYCERYPDCLLLQKLFHEGQNLKANHFIPNINGQNISSYAEDVEQYKELLGICNKQIVTL